MQESSYAEAVLIPYSLFRKCKLEREINKKGTTAQEIIDHPSLPAEVKLDLFKKKKKTTSGNIVRPKSKQDISDDESGILSYFENKQKPFIEAIVDLIKRHSREISWNIRKEITIDDKFYPRSNILEILKYFMKKGAITKGSDVPEGATDLYNKLISVGADESWFKIVNNKAPQRKVPTAKPRKRYFTDSSTDEDSASAAPRPSLYNPYHRKVGKYSSGSSSDKAKIQITPPKTAKDGDSSGDSTLIFSTPAARSKTLTTPATTSQTLTSSRVVSSDDDSLGRLFATPSPVQSRSQSESPILPRAQSKSPVRSEEDIAKLKPRGRSPVKPKRKVTPIERRRSKPHTRQDTRKEQLQSFPFISTINTF